MPPHLPNQRASEEEDFPLDANIRKTDAHIEIKSPGGFRVENPGRFVKIALNAPKIFPCCETEALGKIRIV